MSTPVSIVIRARNEKRQLRALLAEIKRQDHDGIVEVVVVDSESTDGTVEIARDYGAKVVTIKQAEFSYPRSMNQGVAAAAHELVVLMVAHALPYREDWLSSGLKHFEDPKVAGVYCPVRPGPQPTPGDLLLHLPGYVAAKASGLRLAESGEMAVFAATNVILRKSLWEQHNFDERFGAGGEDGEWAAWVIERGYAIMREPRFSVYHSHGLTIKEAKRQLAYYGKLRHPRPFNYSEVEGVKEGRFSG